MVSSAGSLYATGLFRQGIKAFIGCGHVSSIRCCDILSGACGGVECDRSLKRVMFLSLITMRARHIVTIQQSRRITFVAFLAMGALLAVLEWLLLHGSL